MLEIVGVTIIDDVPDPVLQEYVVAPAAVKVDDPESQITDGTAYNVNVGVGVT